MSFASASTQIADFIEDSQGSEALPPLYLTARFEQLSHIHPKVGASGAAAANAFLFTHNTQTYVITSAHTLFSEPMAPNATPPTEVTLGRTPLGNMAYSRFFDVAIFRKPATIHAAAYSSISSGDGSATAHVEDPNADIQFTHVANYTENVNRRTQTGTFFYKLTDGSSGSAISRDGKLVAMVAGCDQKYDNLTVCVPAQTIVDVIAKIPADYPFHAPFNLDAEHIFPQMLTAPIPAALRAYFPDSDLSHLVLYAKDNLEDNLVLPLTMIEANVANKALQGDGKSITFVVRHIQAEAAQRWFAFPQDVYTEGNTKNLISSVVASRGQFVTGEFDKICWDGMNVLSGENLPSVTNQPTQKNKNDIVDDNEQVQMFPFSSMYAYMINSTHTYNTTWLSPTHIASSNQITTTVVNVWGKETTLYRSRLTPDGYKSNIRLCLVRHWTFLVMSGMKGVPDPGYQFIVFANECRRLKGINGTFTDLVLLATTFNTIAEFTDIQAMNFLRILATVFQLTKSTIEALQTFFPISEFNQATADYKRWNWGTTTPTTPDPVLEQPGAPPVFDTYGTCSFNINYLEAEHYKINPSLAQATTAARKDDRATDTVGMELELVYAEMTRLEGDGVDFNQPYYPQSFEIVKSMWDHAHVTMANLLPELSNTFDEASSVDVSLGVVPEALRAWPMLESKQGRGGGSSHLCTKMKEHAVISDAEFHTITQAITPFTFTHHRKELMVYFEFAPEVLEALETQSYNWAGLRGFADSMLAKVASNQLESAFQEWMQTILRLKEVAGQPIEDLKVLDVALSTPLASC